MITYLKRGVFKIFSMLFVICILTFLCAMPVYASETSSESTINNTTDALQSSSDVGDPSTPFEFTISSNVGSSSLSATLQILLVLTVLAIAPSILLMVTSFTRILVILHFTRAALGTQTTPPNQVMVGLALFLTFFIMSPVFMEINDTAIQPFSRGEITQEEAFSQGIEPLREFMFKQVGKNQSDLKLFLNIADIPIEEIQDNSDIPTTVLIPAFIIGELRTSFIIGFLIYLPFIVIDMVVASTLMSMGMMMLPPTVISMPFKILLFILADGWNLIIGSAVKTFLS